MKHAKNMKIFLKKKKNEKRSKILLKKKKKKSVGAAENLSGELKQKH